jgi:hypothetical protein
MEANPCMKEYGLMPIGLSDRSMGNCRYSPFVASGCGRSDNKQDGDYIFSATPIVVE